MRPECWFECFQVPKGDQVAGWHFVASSLVFHGGNGIWKWIGSTARLTKVKRLKIRNSIVFPGSAINIGKAGA
jgi:hypothetical protein